MAPTNSGMPCTVAIVPSVPKEKFDSSFQIVSGSREEITDHYMLPSLFVGIVEPIPVGQPAQDYLEQNVNKTLIKALTALCKEKPKDPVVISAALTLTHTLSLFFSFQLWLADKLTEMNPYKPKLTQVEAPSSSQKHVR